MALGCDDPEVADKVASVLQRGALDASISCVYTACGVSENYSATLFMDGTVMTNVRGFSQFRLRGTTDALTFKATSGAHNVIVTTVDGELIQSGWCNDVFSVETYCTGLNLEAFGVE